MKRKVIIILVLSAAILLYYFFLLPYIPYITDHDPLDPDVSLSIHSAEEPNVYDVRIQIEDAEDSDRIVKDNFIIAYALNGEKYEILSNSERFYFRNRQTNTLSDPYYVSGGSLNGAYINIIKNAENICQDGGSILIEFQVKWKERQTTKTQSDKIVVNITPYGNNYNDISISSENIFISTDDGNRNKSAVYDFYMIDSNTKL